MTTTKVWFFPFRINRESLETHQDDLPVVDLHFTLQLSCHPRQKLRHCRKRLELLEWMKPNRIYFSFVENPSSVDRTTETIGSIDPWTRDKEDPFDKL